jgi:sugar (pentulose or hexulose) kinase
MQEGSTYAVGIDVGTTTVRTVVAHIDGLTGVPTIVGVGQAPNSGMRKGVVVNLAANGSNKMTMAGLFQPVTVAWRRILNTLCLLQKMVLRF